MEIEIELNRDDFEKYNRYYLLKKGWKRRFRFLIAIMLIVPFILEIGEPFSLLKYLFNVALFAIIFIPLMIVFSFISLKYAKRIPDSDGPVLGKKKFVFNDQGLIEETQYGRNEYSWGGVKSIESNRDYIFIFVDAMAAYIFPKRHFENEMEVNNFISYVEDRIKDFSE